MKILSAIAVGFAALSALAQSTTSGGTGNRNIYDLLYLPSAGTNYGTTMVSGLTGTGKGGGSTTDLGGFLIEQVVGRSFSDALSLQLDFNYTQINSDYEYNDGETDSSETRGLSDPTVTARFRVVDSTYRFDLTGGALVSVGDEKFDENGDANNLTGGHELFLTAEIGQSIGVHQWAVGAKYTRHLEAKSESEDDAGDFSSDTEAHNSWQFRAAFLALLADTTYLLPNAGVEFVDAYEVEDSDDLGSFEQDSVTRYRVGAELRHSLTADLMLKASLDHFKVNVSGRFDYWTYGAGATYQF